MKKIIAGLALAVIGVVIYYLPVIMVIALIVMCAIGVVLYYDLRKISANPAEVALVTLFGKIIPKVKKEGLRFFFGYPYVYSYIPVDVTKNDQKIVVEVRTKDNAPIKMLLDLTWNVDGDDPEALAAFLKSGGKVGVEGMLVDIVSESTREWAYSLGNLEEVQGATDKAVKSILETILVRNITEDEMKECRRGNGNFKLPPLGSVISRTNITEIDLTGAMKEAAEQSTRENEIEKAETSRLNNVKDRIKIFTEDGFSQEAAIEIVQTERNRVVKDIHENKISISTETGEMLKEIFRALLPLVGLNAKGGE